MKWTKPTLAVVSLAAATGLLLSGCSGTSDPAATDQPKFLKIEWLANEKAGIDAVVAAYLEQNPDVQIVVTTADTTQYQAALRTELSTGTAADVFYVWPANGNTAAIRQLQGGDFLADLSDESWVSGYPDYIKDLVSIDDKVYVMAPLATSFSPTYNQDVLDAAGLEAPETWSDVLPFCKAATAAGKVAWALPANNAYAGQAPYYNLVADLVYGDGLAFDDELTDGKTTFDKNKGYLEATEKYQDMLDAGCFQPNPTGTPYDESNRMVAAGEAFGTFFIGTRLSVLQAAAPDTNFAIHEFHSDDDPDTNAVTISTQGGGAVNAKGARQDLAKSFLAFMAANIGLYQASLPGTIPTIAEGYTAANANEQVLLDSIAAGHAVHFLNQAWPNARIEAVMNSGLQGLMTGQQSADDVLKAMQVEFDTE